MTLIAEGGRIGFVPMTSPFPLNTGPRAPRVLSNLFGLRLPIDWMTNSTAFSGLKVSLEPGKEFRDLKVARGQKSLGTGGRIRVPCLNLNVRPKLNLSAVWGGYSEVTKQSV